MKKMIAVILLFAMSACFCACGDDGVVVMQPPINGVDGSGNSHGTSDMEQAGGAATAVSESSTPDTESVPPEEMTVPTETTIPAETGPVEEKPAGQYMEELAARYWADEKGGGHIREIELENGERKTVCIDNRGYITATIEPDEKALSGVYGGIYVTETDSCIRIRSASDGSVIFEEATDENTKAYLFDEPFYDGYVLYMVNKKETYNGVTYEIGFVNNKGQWVMEMNSNAKLFDYIEDGGTLSYFEDLRYCGADMLIFACEDYTNRLFHIINNTVLTVVAPEDEYFMGRLHDELLFENGKSKPLYIEAYPPVEAILHADGSYELIPNTPYDDVPILGMFDGKYFDANTNTTYYLRADSAYTFEEAKVYVTDNTGRIIKTYTNFRIKSDGFMGNGTAPIMITNQEGTDYYTLIGTDGEFLFEPIKVNHLRVYDYETGMSLIADYGEVSGQLAVYNGRGELLFELPEDVRLYEDSMRNGVLRYVVEEEFAKYEEYYFAP